jgi:S1 RNA binding domain
MGFFADVGPMQIFVSVHSIPPDLKFYPDANPPNFSNEDQVIERGQMVRIKIMGLKMDVKDIVPDTPGFVDGSLLSARLKRIILAYCRMGRSVLEMRTMWGRVLMVGMAGRDLRGILQEDFSLRQEYLLPGRFLRIRVVVAVVMILGFLGEDTSSVGFCIAGGWFLVLVSFVVRFVFIYASCPSGRLELGRN